MTRSGDACDFQRAVGWCETVIASFAKSPSSSLPKAKVSRTARMPALKENVFLKVREWSFNDKKSGTANAL